MRRTTPRTASRWSTILLTAGLLAAIPGQVLAVDPATEPAPTVAPAAPPSAPEAPAPNPETVPVQVLSPGGPTALDPSVSFSGRGFGHGVGMSQYGARGRALDGQPADAILAQYYRSAVPGNIPIDTQIRVRVLKDFVATPIKPLLLYARADAWTIDGIEGTFAKDARVRITPRTTTLDGVTQTTWRLRITDAAGTVLRSAATTSFTMRGATPETRLQVWSRPSTYDTYLGTLQVVLDAVKPKANVVNELPLESYLRGVVPAEMPSAWPAEALKAQAITARSYAARRLRPGVSWYDVSDDATSQVYLGVRAARPTTDAAIAATASVVLMDGAMIANTLFHSAGGGATEDNENVYVSSTGARVARAVAYLRGSLDRRMDGTPYDNASPFTNWSTKAYALEQVSAMFAGDPRTNVGSLTALDLQQRGVSGRLISVTLIGSLGTKQVSGDVFRSVFNAMRPVGDPMLRSTLFDTKPLP
ncbi:MAG: SpoIID/LytB domain-containing protein [Candidatus Limnocylindrales bacterium]